MPPITAVPATAAPAAGRSIRIRMYRVGFGDCFLVSHLGDQPWHVLVDCGVHAGGDLDTLEDAVRDIAAESGRRLAVIMASHAHEDHIAGFGKYGDLFRQFEIGEVWLPWSEKPDDQHAIALRRKRAALLATLQAHFAVRPPSPAASQILSNLAVARNHKALENLRTRFGRPAELRYVEAGQQFSGPGGAPGLTIRLLGPSRDPEFLKKMEPPKAQRYFRAAAGGAPVLQGAVRPFDQHVADRPAPGPRLSGEEERKLREVLESSPESMAFALEDAVNNCSIVALLSFEGRNLLFPGDAQWGAWKSWIERADGPELLASLDFYKVAHHGSHNATPKSAVDAMTGDSLAAMMSTQSKPWKSIPYDKLFDALAVRTGQRLVRSDWISLPNVPDAPRPAVIPPLPSGFTAGPFWIDYTLPL